MDTNINRLNEEIKNVEGLDGGVRELDKVLGASTERISEVVGKLGENKVTHGATQKVVAKNTSLFDKISELLFSAKTKEIVLPSQEIQKKRVHQSLEKETRKLLRKAKQIQNARHFSAHALEQVIQEIRYLQRLIEELFSLASEKIEALYKQYVLKVA